jgi:hypothetical protein
MTGPRDAFSRNDGTSGGEILERSLILFKKGIVMTAASTLESAVDKGVSGVEGMAVCRGGSFKLGSGTAMVWPWG